MTTPRRSVVVTGLGAICALGDRPDTIFEALCEGRRGFAAPTVFPADVAPGHQVAEVPAFTPQNYVTTGNVRPLDRTGRLALVGVELALKDSGWTRELRAANPVGLILGTMFCSVRTIGEFDRRAQQAGPEYASPMDFSNTVLNAAAGQVAIWQRLRGVNTTIATGATSGLHAIGYAAQLIRSGRADALVAGGAEEICFESFYGYYKAGRLAAANGNGGAVMPFDVSRTGTAMGEGAAFLVLEAEETAKARGANILARVTGFANGYDPNQGGRGSDERGRGSDEYRPIPVPPLAGAIGRALADARLSAADLGVVVSSARGSRVLDAREAAGIQAAAGSSVPVSAVKSMTGEALGASGPLQVITALHAMRGGRLPGVAGLRTLDPQVNVNVSSDTRPLSAKRALVTSIAPEGNCCAVVLAID